MSPWIVGFSVFFGYPLVFSAYLSFNHYDLLSPPRWVGWANYDYLLHIDPQTWVAVRNTVWMIVVAVPLQVIFAFGIAVSLARVKSGGGVFRTIFYLPALAPPVAATLGFVYILNPATGPVNTLLAHLGIQGPLWFQSPQWSKPSLVAARPLGRRQHDGHLPRGGARRAAAPLRVGASSTARTAAAAALGDAPTVSPVILFAVVLGVIQGLQYFTQAYVAASIASGQASQAGDTLQGLGYPEDSTLFYPVLLYQHGFNDFQMGYASAMAMLLLDRLLRGDARDRPQLAQVGAPGGAAVTTRPLHPRP